MALISTFIIHTFNNFVKYNIYKFYKNVYIFKAFIFLLYLYHLVLKTKRFPLCNTLFEELELYTKNMREGEYLFKSQKGKNKPITTTQAYRILKECSNKINIPEVGTHTMRKTFGYFHYKQYRDVAILQQIFNHSSPNITLRYIGINQDEIDNSYRNFSL